VPNPPSITRSQAADAVATLLVLVVGASLLVMAAPLVSALAVVLTAVVYIPMRAYAVAGRTPAG
jgi:hypothetical protein